jgi:hypothetical protein
MITPQVKAELLYFVAPPQGKGEANGEHISRRCCA